MDQFACKYFKPALNGLQCNCNNCYFIRWIDCPNDADNKFLTNDDQLIKDN